MEKSHRYAVSSAAIVATGSVTAAVALPSTAISAGKLRARRGAEGPEMFLSVPVEEWLCGTERGCALLRVKWVFTSPPPKRVWE